MTYFITSSALMPPIWPLYNEHANQLPMGRIMALDLGEKTIGIALSDASCLIAQPLTTLRRQNWRADIKAVLALASEHDVMEIVLGLPLTLSGGESAMTESARDFCEKLRRRTSIPIETWDERLTTVAAERALLEGNVRREKRREVIDQVAAALILEGWLTRRAQRPRP